AYVTHPLADPAAPGTPNPPSVRYIPSPQPPALPAARAVSRSPQSVPPPITPAQRPARASATPRRLWPFSRRTSDDAHPTQRGE
ncbi:MAG TPA: hypothetical protein VKT52_02230, partial [Ktedonobacterales bacterium]|nr:hypothetical protein [Ktedonobacterales bacterium]